MADERNSFHGGFAIGFIASMVLCFLHVRLISVEKSKIHVQQQTLEVYRYTAPKVNDSDETTRPLQILKYGVPERGPKVLRYLNHVIGYDQSRRIPLWVVEYITLEHTTGNADKNNCSFRPDTDRVNTIFSSTIEDYNQSEYEKGHMSAPANHKYSQNATCDTFYLTNIVPLNAHLARNYWFELEQFCRDLAGKYREVRVITGPLFLANVIEGESRPTAETGRFVKYEVIGERTVSVPTHLFKLILVENATDWSSTTLFAGAFVFPNSRLEPGVPLLKFKISLDELELAAGLQFFTRLSGAPLGDLCSLHACRLPGEKEGEREETRSSIMGRVVTDVARLIVVFIWLFVMYSWREHGKSAKNK